MNNHHRIYIENTIRLARTCVVKFDDAAHNINQAIIDEYGHAYVDQNNPRSWKYYQNMAGRYHPTDTMMTVTSIDTGETIKFDIITLLYHPLTKDFYKYRGRYYSDLASRYPTQEALIMGILYAPTPNKKQTNTAIDAKIDEEYNDMKFINDAIEAKDGDILFYDKTLIEENESDLIDELQKWSSWYLPRWVNKSYSLIDYLYPALYIGQFYLHMVQKILNIRIRMCKTAQAHSYFVREYLRSHGMLDRYISALTLKQSLFIYRNIKYIEANSGKRDTFEWLIDHIMTERGLRVYEYVCRHDISDMISDTGKIQTIDPDVIFKRKPINFKTSYYSDEIKTPEQIFLSMNETVKGNENEHYYRSDVIVKKLRESSSNVMQTKVLESVSEDTTDASPYSLECVLLNHLFYYATKDNLPYELKIEYTFPGAKKSTFLPIRDALTLFVYCWIKLSKQDQFYMREHNVTDYPIPIINVNQIINSQDRIGIYTQVMGDYVYTVDKEKEKLRRQPTVDKIQSMITQGNFPDEEIHQILELRDECAIHDAEYIPSSLTTLEEFYLQCKKIHATGLYYFNAIGSSPNYLAVGEMEMITSAMYKDETCVLVREKNSQSKDYQFEEWIIANNYSFPISTDRQYLDMAMGLFNLMTGVQKYKGVSIKEVQRAMLGILKTLSSYTVHFISDINETELTRITHTAPHANMRDKFDTEQYYLETHNSYVLHSKNQANVKEEIDFIEDTVDDYSGTTNDNSLLVDNYDNLVLNYLILSVDPLQETSSQSTFVEDIYFHITTIE